MNNELMELGRRAVACKDWQWLPGMAVLADPDTDADPIWPRVGEYGVPPDSGCIPDLQDPATLGCVQALACAALGVACITVERDYAQRALSVPYMWTARTMSGQISKRGWFRIEHETPYAMAHAAVAALESAEQEVF